MAMTSTSSTILSLLDTLPDSEDTVGTLSQLKIALFALHPSALKDAVSNMSFNIVFNFLNTTNKEQISVVCDVLGRLLSVLDSAVVLDNFKDELNNGLHHPLAEVNLVCLRQIVRMAKDIPEELMCYKDLLRNVIHIIEVENMELTKEATKILVHLGQSQDSLDTLFSGNLYDELKMVTSKSDTIRYRVYELAIEISKWSPEAMEIIVNTGLLQQLVNELYKDDLLVQLNAIELIKTLALFEHGLLFLMQTGVADKLEEMMSAVITDRMAGFLLPALIKCFGIIARLHPEKVCEKYPTFIGMVFNLLSNDDATLKSVAIETVGFIGLPLEGKLVLAKQGNQMSSCIQTLGKTIKNALIELKIQAMTSVANLLFIKETEQNENILSLTESWYRQLFPKPMEFLLSICKQPILEMKTSSLNLYKSMSLLPWGQKEMNNHPGFNEYLLDRSTDLENEGKRLKYDIITNLVESPTATEIFGQPYMIRVRGYHREGPFYVKSQSEVAFERSS